MKPSLTDWRSLPAGEQVRRGIVAVLLGSWAVAFLVLCVAAVTPWEPPAWPFGLPSLVTVAGLAYFWRPARRVEGAWFALGTAALMLGLYGGAFGAFWSLPIGAVVLLGMLVAPRDRRGKR